jgi:hypothetical protein
MDRDKCKEFRAKFADAVKGLEEEMGCTIEIGSITFSSDGLTTKMILTENDKDGKAVNKIAKDFGMNCYRYGMEPTDLGRVFSAHGDHYEVIGCKPKSRKYPIIAKSRSTGREYKFASDIVKFGFSVYESRHKA